MINITKIPHLNALVIKQEEDSRFFISTKDSIIISVPNLAALIKYLVKNGFMDKKILIGILSELEE